ncbi:MAG: ImmA/IrrE family metallo-endopeptidase, partial [Bacteroidota bacterium]
LFINADLTETQEAFQLGKELAFNYLDLKERPYTASMFKVHTFEEVLNNFKASYFAVALLMNRHHVLADLTQLFDQANWDQDAFLQMMARYQASPEMFLHRVSNLLPKYFGIDHFFFLRVHDEGTREEGIYHITKELHLSRLHTPHRNDLKEHYCRRWVALRTLRELRERHAEETMPVPYHIDAQRSRFFQSQTEYLCITIARSDHPTPNHNVSVTLGVQVDAVSRKRVRFLDSPNIPHQIVNKTCERCAIADCQERVASPRIAERLARRELIRQDLQALLNQKD